MLKKRDMLCKQAFHRESLFQDLEISDSFAVVLTMAGRSEVVQFSEPMCLPRYYCFIHILPKFVMNNYNQASLISTKGAYIPITLHKHPFIILDKPHKIPLASYGFIHHRHSNFNLHSFTDFWSPFNILPWKQPSDDF